MENGDRCPRKHVSKVRPRRSFRQQSGVDPARTEAKERARLAKEFVETFGN